MFHTRALDYEPLVVVVVEMLQGALVVDVCVHAC